jgi:hypothetical protein
VLEEDTIRCIHCQGVRFLGPGDRPEDFWCRRCHQPLCNRAICNARCRHFELWLEAVEGKGGITNRFFTVRPANAEYRKLARL